MQCPRVQSPTESTPLKPQPNSAQSLNPQTNVEEQTAQLPPISSGASTSVLTCLPLTPAPRRRKSLRIKGTDQDLEPSSTSTNDTST